MTQLPLDGVRVVDITRLLPGGLATLALSDLGADVVKVELPPNGDHLRAYEPLTENGMGALYNSLDRDKRSVVLDYRNEAGRKEFLELVKTADVLVEGFRPGTLTKYDLDYESLKALKPELVYASITGYGQTGDLRDMPSHGLNMDALAGYAEVTKTEKADYTVVAVELQLGLPRSVLLGGLQAALGISAALVRARSTGEGSYIDVSCWDAAVTSDPWLAFATLNDVPTLRTYCSDNSPKLAPYLTKDDEVIVLCPIEPHLWARFCAVVERPDLLPEDTEGPRVEWDEGDSALYPEVARIMRTKTLAEWQRILTEAGVPASPVQSTKTALSGPVASDRELVWSDVEGLPGERFVGPALRMNGSRGHDGRVAPAPTYGQHTEEVLGELR
ncbi:MAG: alpha-methylacyl-CoA racemase [Acidimicrobiaceae bacterium]|jgi:crotonobetainyl-CoA:carnitine CoA-transferase CaiB-like acyl-CoA transferase